MAAFSPSLVLTARFTPTERPEVLQDRFGCKGVQFQRQSGKLILQLKLRCGTRTQILVPTATVTSLRPIMWHESAEEMLHVPDPFVPSTAPGGISPILELKRDANSKEAQKIDLHWKIQDVAMDIDKSAKVVLNAAHENLVFTYTFNLSKDIFSNEIMVQNLDNVPASFRSSILAQFSVVNIEGCYIMGLLGNKYLSIEETATKHPKKSEGGPHMFSWLKLDRDDDMDEEDDTVVGTDGKLWCIQGQEMAKIPSGVHRLYAMGSRLWSILDRGQRRSVFFGKGGFEYYQISNPGPKSGFSDWDEIVTVGPTTGDKFVCLQPGQDWKGSLILNNQGGTL